MKIVFLSTFYPFRGGISQFNALIYREIEKEHEVEAITFSRQYPSLLFPGKTQLVSPDDAADTIPSKRWLDSINPLTYIRTARRIKKMQPDLIITKYWMTFFAPSLGYVLGRQTKKTKRISVLDNVIPHEKRFFDNWCNRYFLKRNDGFIVMSEKVLKDLLLYVPNARYIHVPHPVYNQFGEKLTRIAALQKLGLEKMAEKKIILFFGIIRDYKGLDLLLEAMAFLSDDFQLIVAGEVYGSFQKYQDIIDNRQLNERVSLFTNYIGDDEVKDYFSAADVCVLPYKSATQSGITSISNHFELPLIATNVGGLAETIHHQKTGLIIEELEVKAIADSINHYFEANLKAQFEAAIKLQNLDNTWKNFAEKIVRFYHELN
jgi:glycosyltransferase involved in cell wall biosynthesis